MHTMKNISKYLGVALLLFGAACSKTQEGTYYNPNKDDSKEIHFIQSSIEKEFAQDAQSGTIDVQIARTGNRGSYTVYLAQKTSDLNNLTRFKVPSKVTIPDGKYSVTVPVEVDLSNFIMGSNYKTTLLISKREVNPGGDGAQVSQFSDKVALSASYELTWEPYMRIGSDGGQVQQLATYHYSLYYTGRDSGLEVEKAVGANIFCLKDWASGVAFKFILHDDNTCTVPGQSIGYFNSNYNEYVYVADMAEYTGNESAYASYPCTFDGKDTFSFYLIYYVSSGYFSQGTEKLVFESEPDTTPIVDIEFQGIETTATGFRAPKLYFSPNSYTKFYKASVVEGDITADTQRQDEIRQQLIDETPLMVGTVPMYDAIGYMEKPLVKLTKDDLFEVVRAHAEDGVDFMTIHCGINKSVTKTFKETGRLMNIVSRGGSLLFGWMEVTGNENPFYEFYDELLEICHEYDVTISLGDSCRPGCLYDSNDATETAEMIELGKLCKRAWAAGVQVMVEGPGHMALDEIAANMKLQKRLCHNAPFYVLGPLVTDIGVGYDHITAAIGGAISASSGADFLCYVTPAEHLCLPNAQDVLDGLMATKTAEHAADIAKKVPHARDMDDKMGQARRKLDWDAMWKCALDPVTGKKRYEESPAATEGTCTMCGKMCAVRTVNKVFEGTTIDLGMED